MSWLLLLIIALTAVSVVLGVQKGFIRTVVSTFFLVFAIVLTGIISPCVESVLGEYTSLIAFICAVIIIQIVLKATDIVTKLPIIGFANRLGGAITGGVRALLWVFVFFAFLPLVANTDIGGMIMEEITNDSILSFLYNHNILVKLILKL